MQDLCDAMAVRFAPNGHQIYISFEYTFVSDNRRFYGVNRNVCCCNKRAVC